MVRVGNVCLIIILFIVTGLNSAQGRQKYVFTQNEMGSPFTITIYTKDSLQAALAAGRAFSEVNRLNQIFSDYIDSSELNRLSYSSGNGKYVRVSAELFIILKRAKEASRVSGGAFDVTVGPLVRIWRWARKENKFPGREELNTAKRSVGYRYIHLDSAHRSAMLEKQDMKLDLGGIAKGYAAQAALDVVRQAGFSSVMVNAGGDLALGDPPPHRSAWQIGISVPESYDRLMNKNIFLRNKAVATSGDIYQYVEWNGKRYSHIIDPKTGYGVTRQRNVTVIADDGATADWLASACSVLSGRGALRLIRRFPGAAVLIAEKRNNKIYTVSSDNFKQFYQE